MRELQVSAIKNGVVIDHIPSKQAFKMVKLLGLENTDDVVTIAFNLSSKSLKEKCLIKIADRTISENELAKIAILAPSVTINIIEDFEVIEKKMPNLPNEILDIIKCNNRKCISNHENIKSRFILKDKKETTVKCYYCEKIVKENDIVTK